MDERLLDDALLMQAVTEGDIELLAIDLWLHEAFHRSQPDGSDGGRSLSEERPQ